MPKRDLPPPAVAIDVPRWPACVAILAIGPPWLVLAIGLVAALTLLVLPRLGIYLATCKVAIALFLVTRLPTRPAPAARGGRPHKRRRGHHASSDFVFPQMALDDESGNWSPDFLDYFFSPSIRAPPSARPIPRPFPRSEGVDDVLIGRLTGHHLRAHRPWH